MIGKLQYTGIYGKLNHRNKLWSCDKLSYDKVDNDISNSYLCGDNNLLNLLIIHPLNYQLNQEERADRH